MSSKDKKEKWLALASFFANMGAGLGQGGPGGAWGERIAGQISNQAQAIAAQRAKEEADKKAKRGFLGKIAGTVVGRIPCRGYCGAIGRGRHCWQWRVGSGRGCPAGPWPWAHQD